MKTNYLKSFGAVLFMCASVQAQNPTTSIANWKNNANGAYTIIHDDYGDTGVDGIWQYADTIAFNRGLRFTFGAIANSCEQPRNVNGYSSPYDYALQVMINQHGHEIMNHSHTHDCAVGNAGWTPCDMQVGWGQDVNSANFFTQLNTAHNSIASAVGFDPVYYIFPYDRFTHDANDRLKTLGYIGSRTGWSSPNPGDAPFIRSGYNNNDPDNILPDNDGFFRNGVQVFDDADANLSDNGQLSELNGTVNQAINDGEWCNRELHNVGPTGWGNVSINAYRAHLDYVKDRVDNGELFMAPASEILTYLFQKAKFSAASSYSAQEDKITVTFSEINPQINVDAATYLNDLVYKTSLTFNVDLDGLTGTWTVWQDGNQINDFKVENGVLTFNAYPHEGEVEILRNGGNTNTPPYVDNSPNIQNLVKGFSPYQMDLTNIFEDLQTSDANLIYTYSGNTNIQVSISNGIATISADNSYSGNETVYFEVEDEGGLTIGVDIDFVVDDPFANQTPYGGTAISIPGRIEAENFDEGPEGAAYNEEFSQYEPNESSNPYRTDHPVDIEDNQNGGYCVGYTVAGEWLEYTIDVQTDAYYTVTFSAAEVDLGGSNGSFRILVDNAEVVPETAMEFTSGWYDFASVQYDQSVMLTSGTHILRIEVINNDANLDYVDILTAPVSSSDILKPNHLVYPNPATDQIRISGVFTNAFIYNTSGQLVKTTNQHATDVSTLEAGLYIVRFEGSNEITRFVISK